MWDPTGKTLDANMLGPLAPEEALFEFEGEYLTFVARDPNGGLLLVHNLCVFQATSRYLVAPIDERILGELKAGRLDVYSGLRQPRCWVADIVPEEAGAGPWRVASVTLVDFQSIPRDYLPRPGAMITPDLDPVFRLRLIGAGVGPGKTSAADVRMAAQAAEFGLRGLARVALDQKKKAGQVPRDVRHYSDLPYQYSRAASFEIAFGRPRDRLPGIDDEVFAEMGSLLELGLQSLREGAEERSPIEGLNDDQTAQLFEAIKALTPPLRGDVERVELGGVLAERLSGSKILTRDDRTRTNQRIKASPKIAAQDPPFRVTGVVESADQGTYQFTLRQVDPPVIGGAGAVTEIEFAFEDWLFDAVSDAWNSQDRVSVVGERVGGIFKALDIQAVSDASIGRTEPDARSLS